MMTDGPASDVGAAAIVRGRIERRIERRESGALTTYQGSIRSVFRTKARDRHRTEPANGSSPPWTARIASLAVGNPRARMWAVTPASGVISTPTASVTRRTAPAVNGRAHNAMSATGTRPSPIRDVILRSVMATR
jgi:hypothetical protein